MCGIFGVVEFKGGTIDKSLIRQSAETQTHRGPDSIGVFTADGVGLGHNRLSLVDLSERANQPFLDETGRYALVFNGEIYNFRELKAELEREGQSFRTTSDTEVLLYLLLRQGAEVALPKLNGMFAFALVDLETRQVTMARDRFGMKPLHYHATADRLIFASETAAFGPWMEMRPHAGTVAAYLMNFGGPTRGVTFFDGIYQLGPGEVMTAAPGQAADIRPFFALTDFIDDGEYDRLLGRSETEIVDEFEALMTDSIRLHAFADARVGAFCSGGVDSSLIVALASRSNSAIELFHANVVGSWSEVEAARALARHLKLDLNAVDVVEQDFVTSIPRVMRHYGYPFTYHPNCGPLMMIAGLARDTGVKGLLSGEGSDEMFLGYPWLGRKRITDAWDRIRDGLAGAVRRIPAIGTILLPEQQLNAMKVRNILNGREMLDDLNKVSDALSLSRAAARDPRMRWTLDYMHHHLRTLLHRNDTMGMAASIEARFPFLENRIAHFAVNLPARHKLKFSPFTLEKAHPFIRDKWVVREVADRYIPRDLSQRIKIGFWTTVFQRLDISERYFATSGLGDMLSLSRRQFSDLVAEASPAFRLKLLHLDVWQRICVERQEEAAPAALLSDHVRILTESEARRTRRAGAKKKGGAAQLPSAPV